MHPRRNQRSQRRGWGNSNSAHLIQANQDHPYAPTTNVPITQSPSLVPVSPLLPGYSNAVTPMTPIRYNPYPPGYAPREPSRSPGDKSFSEPLFSDGDYSLLPVTQPEPALPNRPPFILNAHASPHAMVQLSQSPNRGIRDWLQDQPSPSGWQHHPGPNSPSPGRRTSPVLIPSKPYDSSTQEDHGYGSSGSDELRCHRCFEKYRKDKPKGQSSGSSIWTWFFWGRINGPLKVTPRKTRRDYLWAIYQDERVVL
ncbi:hypothetical protein PUNSTDRAFT_45536 [Punctularia strigosozonata HHB-11173 SS5]|uniref:uncharacterized protein n=1 Tax=Punctularia strigosozonata (strain HHB-11173) TaxID=741275 RepID=UPI0004416844|nr:uncharacterized protein PUNSTDRAFT_45536 [Punctularia strigosozonata HHB-11173 SS5]EIN06994.1 hypothetical protein PUNSTDRAFT_45536 [Punctularia strigosozonata HHB-11173 SS5]